jgi:hypothetical protein
MTEVSASARESAPAARPVFKFNMAKTFPASSEEERGKGGVVPKVWQKP